VPVRRSLGKEEVSNADKQIPMRRHNISLLIALTVAFLFLLFHRSPDQRPPDTGVLSRAVDGDRAVARSNPNSENPDSALASGAEPRENAVQSLVHEPAGFSPELQRLVDGIHAGRPVRLQVGESESRYFFRATNVTTENFRISAGADASFPAEFEVFEGRRLLENGQPAEDRAALAVVNDSVSMAYTTQAGDFLIESDASGQLVQLQLRSSDPDSRLGDFSCVQQGQFSGTMDASSVPFPRETDVSLSLAGEFDTDAPDTAGAIASHPYFRLGKRYDASLKDLNVLMISGSTQTGPSSNFSSRAATYFTYAATLRDVYEWQLGLRYQLQELILIADDPGLSPENDVEYDDSVVPNDKSSAIDDLSAVRNWVVRNRPRSTYQWGHVMAWTLVNGDARGMVGWAFTKGYGTLNSAFSVNEREMNWGVIVHEMGHNIGAAHTNGGAMNAQLSLSNPRSDFFTENAASGGFTAASEIYDYMSDPIRPFIYGPAEMRNPSEMPFGVDDAVSTPADTAVTFNPLANDLTATPLFGAENTLRLVEVGQIFPKAAGSVSVSGESITFTPAAGYTGNVWFAYTLRGSVGNGGLGWLHSADVIITVGGNSSDPDLNPALSTTDDVVRDDFSAEIRLNPLLNDEATGRLWVGGVDGIGKINGVTQAGNYSDSAFRLVSATVVNGNGTVTLETLEVTRNEVATLDHTGYLIYTPSGTEPDPVVIEYTVEDADGNQSTGNIFINFSESVALSLDRPNLVEREGRVATITLTRSGSTAESEWVDFFVAGSVDLTGSTSDVAIAGYDAFDPATGFGRITIPAGQASAEIVVSAMQDAVNEGDELLTFSIMALETMVIADGQDVVQLEIIEQDSIDNVIYSEDFDSFPGGKLLANGWSSVVPPPYGGWTAKSGGTTSPNTGPTNDHTQGDAAGQYLYREASGNTNQQSDLLSPVLDLSAFGDLVLEFYYHMFGAAMGELRVDVFANGVWHLDVMEPRIGQQQNSGDAPWAFVRINISDYNSSDFQVRFRGITGADFTSDMAIDDFAVGEPLSTPESPSILGQPQSQAVLAGDPVYLSVVARGLPSPTYQWKKDGMNIDGATRSVLYLESFQSGNAGDYSCEVHSGSSTTSAIASLTLADPNDLDGDGLPDDWELLYFDSTDAIDGSQDSDGDGVLDFFEYIYGSNPTDPNSRGSGLLVAPASNGTDMIFEWVVQEGLVLGLDYLVEVSTTLSPWSPIPEADYTIQSTTNEGMTQLELTLPLNYTDRAFLKLSQPQE